MQLTSQMSAVVTGGGSGLGLATTEKLVAKGVHVVVADYADKKQELAEQFGDKVTYIKADVTQAEQVEAAIAAAVDIAPLRVLVICAGFGGAIRLVERDGSPGELEKFENIIRVNIIGTYNALRFAAAAMAKNEVINGERGACVLTASAAAYEGQIGQIA